MEDDKQNTKHGLGLDLLSSKAASSFNSFLRQQRSNDTTERTIQHSKHDPAERFARRKEGRNGPKVIGGLGLKHIENSWEDAGTHVRSRGSLTSPITQRKKAGKKVRPVHNTSTPRIQVDTNIQVKQTNMPLQVFPSHPGDITKYIGEQKTSQANSQRVDPSVLQYRLSAVTSNTPRGKISWWLKGTNQADEGQNAATASPSPMSTLRLAGISPSDGPIPIGIDQDTLVSLNTQRSSNRSNITESTPTIMVTPAREKEMMISRWSPSSPGSTAVPASMARASSIYSSMNGLCQPTSAGVNVPPVPALPNHAIQNNALIQNTSNFNYSTRETITSDPFTSPPRVIKRIQTNESESTIIEEDETPPADETVDRALEATKPAQKPQPPTTDYSRSRPDLTVETTVPTPRRSHGWWNIITTPFDFLNSSAKDRKSIPAMPFTNNNLFTNKTHTTPQITELVTPTDSTFPSPTMTQSSVDQCPEAHVPTTQRERSSPDGMARSGVVQHLSPVVSRVPSYQRSVSNFSQHQHQYQQNFVEPITVNVTHIDQRTYNSYGSETQDVEKGSFTTSAPQERHVKTTTNRREFSTTTTEEVQMREGLNSQNAAYRTFESPRTVPPPPEAFPERQTDKLREKFRGRSRHSHRAESRERPRDVSKDNYNEKDLEMLRERSRDRSRGWLTDRSRDTSRNKSRYSSTVRSNSRSSEPYSEKHHDRYRRDDSPASKKYSVKVSGNPRGLFPSNASNQPSSLPFDQGSGGGTGGTGMPLPVPAAAPGSFGEALRSWLPRRLSPRNLSLRKKPGRCILFSILIGFIIILIAILVPVMTLNQDNDDGNGESGGEDSDALWLNVTNFPAVPSGITTVAKTNAVVKRSGCVFPTTLWSCALPKEKHSSDDSFESDEPPFRIKIGSRDESSSDEIESLPSPPSLEDQTFLGNTTDRNEEPFEGEETPFYISLLPSEGEESSERKVKRQLLDDDDDDDDSDADNNDDEEDDESDEDEDQDEDENEDEEEDDNNNDDETNEDEDEDNEEDDDGDVPDLTAIIPSPSIGRDGKAAPANLLAFPKEQPLRLYNRGLDDEYYGFYIYYDRSIFLQSIAALNGSDSERISQDEEDRDGGAALEDASVRCTWAQTRLLVQIWTRRDGKRLLPGNDDATASGEDDDDSESEDDEKEQSSVENLLEAGIFPYPVTLTLDRHGGSIQDKMLYCYGVDDEGEIITTERKFELEDRAFEGRLVNPAQGPFGNVTVDVDEGGPGGVDGGTGGCSCEFVNWMER